MVPVIVLLVLWGFCGCSHPRERPGRDLSHSDLSDGGSSPDLETDSTAPQDSTVNDSSRPADAAGDAGECQAQLDSDPANCGRCGRDCGFCPFKGPAVLCDCVMGRCEPQLLRQDQPNPTAIAVGDEEI